MVPKTQAKPPLKPPLNNSLLSSYSATCEQALHADLKLVPRAVNILGFGHFAFLTQNLSDCETVTHTHKLSCRDFLIVAKISLLT